MRAYSINSQSIDLFPNVFAVTVFQNASFLSGYWKANVDLSEEDGLTNHNVFVRNDDRPHAAHSIVDFELSGDRSIDNGHGRMSGGRARRAVERQAKVSDCANCRNDDNDKEILRLASGHSSIGSDFLYGSRTTFFVGMAPQLLPSWH